MGNTRADENVDEEDEYNLKFKGKAMKKMKIWAHRGASGYAPENTMERFPKRCGVKQMVLSWMCSLPKTERLW